MNGVTYYSQWQLPELMWRVDAELSLVEVAQVAHLDDWFLSRMDLHNIDYLLGHGDMVEVAAP